MSGRGSGPDDDQDALDEHAPPFPVDPPSTPIEDDDDGFDHAPPFPIATAVPPAQVEPVVVEPEYELDPDTYLLPEIVEPAPAVAGEPLFTLSVGTIAWAAVIGLFVALRLGPIWQAPVTGAELIHLSGAWQASIGVNDDRFIATLFQAVTSVFLTFSDSEAGPRIIATLATWTVPFALWRLRPLLGNAGALLALLLLAIDAPGIVLGTSASAMGFDVALAIWGFALIAGVIPNAPPVLAVAGFLGATAGPVVLPLAIALGVQMAYRRTIDRSRGAAFLLAGAVLGAVVAFIQFGTGVASSPLPSIQLFVDSFDQDWSTASGIEVLGVYSLAQVIGGAAAVAWWLRRTRSQQPAAIDFALLWAAVSAVWAVVSLNANSPVALAALALPLAILSGPALSAGLNAMWRADWSVARFMIPAGAVVLLVAANYVVDWGRLEQVGSDRAKIIVAGMLLSAAVAFGPIAYFRAMRPALLAPLLVIAAIPALNGAFGAGLSANPEPLLSPRSSEQARNLRNDVLREAAERGGQVVIHPSLEREITWAFRHSGTLLVASPPPPEAAVLIWPAGLPQPEGYLPLEGQWALTEAVHIPTDNFLDHVHWLIDSNSLVVTPESIAVYTRTSE